MRRAIAIIDDCQRVALQAADWSAVLRQADVRVFTQPWRVEDDLFRALAPFGMDVEPRPMHHPLRSLPNVVLTPHLGCVVPDSMERFYRDSVENVLAWLRGATIRIGNAQSVPGRRPGAPA